MRPLYPNLDDLPYPAWELFNEVHFTNHYLMKAQAPAGSRVIGTFEGSRGCVFTCTYCSSPALMGMYGGASWRREKSRQRLADEILEFERRYGCDFVYFVDEIMLTKEKMLREMRDIFSTQVRKPFSFQDRPELMTEEKIRLISEAGATHVSIGVENGDELFRKMVLDRNVTQEKESEAFHIARRYGIKTNAFNMVGIPGEDKEIIRSCFKLLDILQPDTFQVFIFYPLPGTELYKTCEEKGYIEKGAYDDDYESYYKESILDIPGYPKKQITAHRDLLTKFAGYNSRYAEWMFNFFLDHYKLLPIYLKIVSAPTRLRVWLKYYGFWGSVKRGVLKLTGRINPIEDREGGSRLYNQDLAQVRDNLDPIYQAPERRTYRSETNEAAAQTKVAE